MLKQTSQATQDLKYLRSIEEENRQLHRREQWYLWMLAEHAAACPSLDSTCKHYMAGKCKLQGSGMGTSTRMECWKGQAMRMKGGHFQNGNNHE